MRSIPGRPEGGLTASATIGEPAAVDRVATLIDLGAATLGECGAATLSPRIRPLRAGTKLAAPILTVRCEPADNLAIHVAVASASPGAALVVDASREPDRGYWGEVLTVAAGARNIAGLVIDGGVRDTDAILRLEFPVFASVVALRGAAKVAGGTVGVPITLGDTQVFTGDWVVGDSDGVVIVPLAALPQVVAAAHARVLKEVRLLDRLRDGDTTTHLLGLNSGRVVVADGP